jgi:tRNA/rRNA methyltransferase
MKPDLDRVRIVLVEPQGAFNIGSVARVMMNMGFSDLALVNPVEFRNDDGYRGAVNAKPLLNGARVFPSIADAVGDTNLVVGTTRRRGKQRKIHCCAEDLSGYVFPLLHEGRVSILFGREESGLTTDEAKLCSILASIPASPGHPSLNLSHAVAIICYRLFVDADDAGCEILNPVRRPADNRELEELVEYIEFAFGEMGFFSKGPPDYVVPLFRRIFGRALLDQEEIGNLSHIFHRLYGLFLEKSRRGS